MANGKKTGGRRRGTPNKTTKELKPILLKLIQKELKNLPDLISELETKERIDAITKLLPYVMPKMKQVDYVSSNSLEPLEIRIIKPPKSNILIDGRPADEVMEERESI